MKVGLVLEGGSRKCMFTAGVTDYFIDEGITFPYVCGVSGGAHGAINFVSKQRGRLRYVLTPSRLRSGHKAHVILDGIQAEYENMCGESFYGGYPFDFKKLFESKIDFEFGLTCAETGKIVYLNERKSEKRLMKLMHGTCALPMLFPLVEIDGKHYADGCVSNSVPFDRPFEKGCDKVIVISTKSPADKPSDFRKERAILAPRFERRFPELFDALMNRYDEYFHQMEEMQKLVDQGKVYVLKPEEDLCWVFATSQEKLDESYIHGYKTAVKYRKEIMDFIKD